MNGVVLTGVGKTCIRIHTLTVNRCLRPCEAGSPGLCRVHIYICLLVWCKEHPATADCYLGSVSPWDLKLETTLEGDELLIVTAVAVLVTRVHTTIILDVSSPLSEVTDRTYCKSDDEEALGGPHCRTVPIAVVVSYVRVFGSCSPLQTVTTALHVLPAH